ncbi:MAG: SpaA isopeptide-forming pilin-related protein [Eubacteriales bacterium]|nr:SpaA isopeptide-forming pilin-related protein [Eubacteriales bacterium]
MKNLFKKLSVIIFSIIMIVAMCMSAMAAPLTETKATDTAKVTIEGVEDAANVVFYRIVSPIYGADDKDFQSYTAETITSGTDTYKISDISNPTKNEIENIYKALKGGATNNLTTKSFTGAAVKAGVDLTAGTWMAIITGGNKLYNVMIASVNYITTTNAGTSSTVIEGTTIQEGAKLRLGNVDLYAKVSEPTVDKTVEGGNPSTDERSASVGDELKFTIEADKPEYPENSTNKTFFIADEMSEGLSYIPGSLKVNGIVPNESNEVKNDDDEIIARVKVDVQNRKIHVAYVYDKISATPRPQVTYSAVLNSNAVVGTNANTNKAELIYSTNPTNGGNSVTNPDNPPSGEGYGKTEDTVTIYSYQVAFKKYDAEDYNKDPKVYTPLSGAVYGIYKDENCTDLIDIAKTNDSGIGVFKQIEVQEDPTGNTYYIKELVAPTGYSLDSAVHTVTIKKENITKTTSATVREYTTDASQAINNTVVGYLKENDPTLYPTKINATYLNAYIKTETTTSSTEIGDGQDTVEVGPFTDTKITELPSTGGIGTYIFTIVGVIVMAVMASLYFMKKRREAE